MEQPQTIRSHRLRVTTTDLDRIQDSALGPHLAHCRDCRVYLTAGILPGPMDEPTSRFLARYHLAEHISALANDGVTL